MILFRGSDLPVLVGELARGLCIKNLVLTSPVSHVSLILMANVGEKLLAVIDEYNILVIELFICHASLIEKRMLYFQVV